VKDAANKVDYKQLATVLAAAVKVVSALQAPSAVAT